MRLTQFVGYLVDGSCDLGACNVVRVRSTDVHVNLRDAELHVVYLADHVTNSPADHAYTHTGAHSAF